MNLEYISTKPSNAVELQLIPKNKQKITKEIVKLDDFLVKGVTAKGIRMSPREVKKVVSIKTES
jgi:topoisomerase-4 subunit A